MQSVGFKEWALVCEALGRGEQTIILRKGGIAEGRAGFAFRHREFFLFPTFFHEQVEKMRGGVSQVPAQREGEIEIKFFTQLECSAVITDWAFAAALEPFHDLRAGVVRERFDYKDAPGIHVAFVRMFQLAQPWVFPDAARFGGCRSWVTLPISRAEVRMAPVLSEREHAQKLDEFRMIISEDAAASYHLSSLYL